MATTSENHGLDLDPKYDNYDYPIVAANPQSGHPGHTTPEQNAQVHQLRMILESAGYKDRLDTLTLLRFLRARKFNVELSKQMFLDSEKWRSNFGGGLDQLVRDFDYHEKPQIFAYYPQYYHKTDKDGRPVYIEQLGKIDLTALRNITSDERMLQSLVVEYEKFADPRLPACSRKAGSLQETSCTIFDAKGVGISRAGQVYGYLQQASAISQNYYPERLGKMYIINAPWGFSGVFAVIKRFLDPVTVAKIHVLGGSYQDELLKQIPKENLPSQFGGSCTCEGGCELSDSGPWHDPQYATKAWWEKPKVEAEAPAKEGEAAIDTDAVNAGPTESKPVAVGGEAAAAPGETKAPAPAAAAAP